VAGTIKTASTPTIPNGAGTARTARAGKSPRSLITGKAFFVYWPHGKPFGPDIRLNPDFRLPFRPYVERMKWIR
jgi:signal peptidase I